MATTIFQGFYDDLLAGELTGAPDLRVLLVMSSFSGETEEDAQTLSDITTLDEFDGVGYSRLDLAGVAVAYDSTADEVQFDGTDGSFGDPVAPGSDVIYGMVVYRYVDGTAANDVVHAFTSDGGFGVNANNGPLSLTVPAAGLLFIRPA
jgi:hypothetical protein